MNSITAVPGIKVGHAQNEEGLTGCTVILAENEAVVGGEVRGSAPGTREIALLDPVKTVTKAHAILLTGGSAFGLEATQGVMEYLEENDCGYDTGVTKVPIVPGAVIFDLEIGDCSIRPDCKMGYRACRESKPEMGLRGNIGVGLGATVGKLAGMKQATKGGLGLASKQVGDLIVGALVVVNALGEVVDPVTGEIIAGIRTGEGFKSTVELMKEESLKIEATKEQKLNNTTLGVVATNAKLNKVKANKVAEMSHNGLAQVIRPVHTEFDGDTIFALATGKVEADVNLVGTIAIEVIQEAILDGIKAANSIAGFPASSDIK